MSTLHKVKAYFGMAPMDDYDDEYYDDDDRPSRGYPRREDVSTTRTALRRAATTTVAAKRRRARRLPRRLRRRASTLATPRDSTAPHRRFALAARLDPRRAGDGSAPDGDVVRRGQPAVEDHHAAAQGLQRGPHHRRALPRRHPGDHGPGVDGQRRRQAARRLRGRAWPSRCADPSTRSPPRCSCCRPPTSTSSPRSAAASPRPASTPTSRPDAARPGSSARSRAQAG